MVTEVVTFEDMKDSGIRGRKAEYIIWDEVSEINPSIWNSIEEKESKMSFMPVAPLPLLKDLFEVDPELVGRSHLLLAHDVKANEEAYRIFFDSLRARVGVLDIIMDNSAVELKEHAGLKTTLMAAEAVGANYFALPDVLHGAEATIKQVSEALIQLPYAYEEAYEDSNRRIAEAMYIIQGKSIEDFVLCMEALKGMENNRCVSMIGIPRLAQDQNVDRLTLVKLCRRILPTKRIHLLGFSNSTIRDLVAAGEGCSIDSAVPLRAGQQKRNFSWANVDYGPRGDFFEDPGTLTMETIRNLRFVRDCMKQ